MDSLLNIAFFVFHTSWIAFNCAGWIWRRTRPWQLATVSLTALSWFGLGVRYGWGYCPFTDWHWQVRARLGHQDPPSYIQLLVRELTGTDPGPIVADTLAVVTLAGVSVLSVVLYVRDRHGPPRADGVGDIAASIGPAGDVRPRTERPTGHDGDRMSRSSLM